MNEHDIVYRLRKRAEIRRQIPSRKSVQEGKPDRIAALLDEAAEHIEHLRESAQRDITTESHFYIDKSCLERGCACHDSRVSEAEIVTLFRNKSEQA